jgi:hypothetical protein
MKNSVNVTLISFLSLAMIHCNVSIPKSQITDPTDDSNESSGSGNGHGNAGVTTGSGHPTTGATSGATTGATGGAGGSTATGGSTGTGMQGDGQVGSACGTCAPGLVCDASAPGGYCTRQCMGNDCGANAYCYSVGSASVCLAACSSNQDCRTGYACQGQPGVCFPAQSSGSGDTSSSAGTGGGDFSNASLQGCYWENNDITFRLYFDGNGSFQDVSYNAASGTTTSSGSYQVSGAQVTLNYDDGSTKTYGLELKNGQPAVVNGNAVYAYTEAMCS